MKFLRKYMRRSTQKKLRRLLIGFFLASVGSWLFVLTHTRLPPGHERGANYDASYDVLERDIMAIDDEVMRELKRVDLTEVRPEPKPEQLAKKKERLKVEDVTWIKPYLDDPIINPHPYKYALNPTQICERGMFLLVYVHSHPKNSERRSVIRKTWGNPANFPDTRMSVVFILGKTKGPDSSDIEDAIQLESMQFEDIVQENFIDAYENITLKATAALRWITRYCSNTKYVMKTDDDALINTYAIIRHLTDLESSNVYNQKLLMCRVWWKMDVSRKGKWAVPEDMIPDEYYPPYCSGIMYVMSIDVALVISRMALSIRPFWVDDVYITGLIPGRIGLQLSDFIWAYAPVNELDVYYSESEWYKYAYTHISNMTVVASTWARIQKYARAGAIPQMDVIAPGQIAKDYKMMYHKQVKQEIGDSPGRDDADDAMKFPHDYPRVLEPESGCDEDTFMVNFVYTEPGQAGRRRLVRHTWGKESYIPGFKMRTIFVSGFTREVDARQELELEAEDHGDILLEDFDDDFNHRYLKSIGAFKWIAENCPHVKFVLKADDDTMVNMFALSQHLQDLHSVEFYRTGLIMCNRLWTVMPVAREGMYAVAVEDFSEELLPPYCSGVGWVATADVTNNVLLNSYRKKPPFVIDDALITGWYVREQGGVKHYDLRKSFVETKDMAARLNSDEWYKYLFSHVYGLVEAKSIWKKLAEVYKSKPKPKVSIIEPGRLW